MRFTRTLRSRLYLWFLGTIVAALASSALVIGFSRPEPPTGDEVLGRTIGAHLAELWSDAAATNRYVQQVHEVTGFGVQLIRDPQKVPPFARRVAHGGGVIAEAGQPSRIIVPVVHGNDVVGALRIERDAPVRVIEWWRPVAGFVAAIVVLAFAAGRIADLLAKPLEQLGTGADRFAGDLSFRTNLADLEKRGVSQRGARRRGGLQQMADRVEGMVRGQRELLGAISHELRSPLGRARIALEIARDRIQDAVEGPGPASAQSPGPQLDEIEKQLKEVDAILGNLLAVTRAGLADLRKESVPIASWVRARLAEEPGAATFDTAVDDGVRLPADPALLGRVLKNLLANARAHGHPDAEPLVVGLELRGEKQLVLFVRDKGPGFSPELLERAFDPFVRGDASRTRTNAGGVGLGLALVRRIAEAHGGEAYAKNLESGGAEVGVVLPIT